VVPDARAAGIGLNLKLAQREEALRAGVDVIEWTFDPLQAQNAHLNFARLGVIVEEYEENIYGESSSPLHKGAPTDRFVAEWRLTSPHVERRLAAPSTSFLRDSAVMTAVLLNPSVESAGWLGPGRPALDSLAERLLVEIPTGFSDLLARAPDLALEWRTTTRSIFTTYFARGYRVVDFFLSRETGRGQYLLAPRPK
jgi:predicted GNAT superfamily acetyltransferase